MAVPNPWSAEFWNITSQGEYVKRYGLSVAKRTARLAGSAIGALRPKAVAVERIIERQWILSKRTGGGGTVGSSGEGPPS